MSATELLDDPSPYDLLQEGERSCKKINDLCKSGELENRLRLETAFITVNPMTASTVPQHKDDIIGWMASGGKQSFLEACIGEEPFQPHRCGYAYMNVKLVGPATGGGGNCTRHCLVTCDEDKDGVIYLHIDPFHHDGVRAFLADAPDAPDASAPVAKKARKDSPPPLKHIRISYFLFGKDGPKNTSPIVPPVSILDINPWTKRQVLKTYGSARFVFKMPKILQFPGAYAVWTDEPLEGIEPLDPDECAEPNAEIARDFTPSSFKYLYAMASDSILA